MTTPDITYYAKLAGNRTRQNPSGIVRRIHTSPGPTDEAFGRDLQWHPTEYLRRYWLGHNDVDHEEITADEAQVIIDRWRAKWANEDAQNGESRGRKSTTTPTVTYYAVLAAGGTRKDPSGVVRRIHTTPVPTDEAFGRNMQWHPTEYLRRYWLGHNDDDHEEITADEAQVIIDRWRAKWANEDAPAVRSVTPIRYDQTGLRGRTAELLTDLPTNDAGVPVALPAGTTRVVIVDDTPNSTLTLRVHPVGEVDRVVFVDHTQLALAADGSERSSL